MTCHDHELAPAKGLHTIELLFKVLSGLLALMMVLQVVSGLTGAIDISYGVLLAEAIRLLVFAAVLWGVGDLSELFIKSHCDLRAIRILLARQAALDANAPAAPGVAGTTDHSARGDETH